MSLKLLVLVLASIWQLANCGVINSDTARKCMSNPTSKINAMLDLPSVDNTLPRDSQGDIAEVLSNTLRERTSRAQAPIINGLRAINPNMDIQSFWIVNRIAVNDVPCALLPAIASLPYSFAVRTEKVMDVSMLIDSLVIHDRADSNAKPDGNPQWGVQKINAPKVWAMGTDDRFKGKGVVVSCIDTGVRGTHEALKDNYRGDEGYGFLDGISNTTVSPNDGMGHGSHVMGTIAGSKGIGVAPGATWMACKGCDDEGRCVEKGLLTCGEWVTCPYQTSKNGQVERNCEMRPDLVANSWGSFIGTDMFFNEVLANWQAVGIIPVFAIGNTGPVCGTTGSPGNQDNVISVGATDNKDKIARFSSRGPPTGGNATVKPEVSAPGKDIFSSWSTGDNAYSTISGTSMACPHTAGAVALLLAKNKASFTTVEKTLKETAYHTPSPSPFETCTFTAWPNNAYGHGRIDVEAAFKNLPDLPGTEPPPPTSTDAPPTF